MAWKVKLAQNHADSLRLEVACSGFAGEQWDSVLIEAPVDQISPEQFGSEAQDWMLST